MKTYLMVKAVGLALWAAVSLASQAAKAGDIPAGSYAGKASFKSLTTEGKYAVETVIEGTQVRNRYTHTDGTVNEWNFDRAFTKNGLFNVKVAGVEVGKGYCIDYVELCHYQLQAGKVQIEETLVMHEGKLYKYGSKVGPDVEVRWQESLERK